MISNWNVVVVIIKQCRHDHKINIKFPERNNHNFNRTQTDQSLLWGKQGFDSKLGYYLLKLIIINYYLCSHQHWKCVSIQPYLANCSYNSNSPLSLISFRLEPRWELDRCVSLCLEHLHRCQCFDTHYVLPFLSPVSLVVNIASRVNCVFRGACNLTCCL